MRKDPEYPHCTSATRQNKLAGSPFGLQCHNNSALLGHQYMGTDSPSGKLLLIICLCQAKWMTQKIKSAATVASNFVQTERAIFDAGPELPKTKPDPVEAILNMDEETFRMLFHMPKVDLQRSGDQEMNEVDWM